jgi:hypothetical protein
VRSQRFFGELAAAKKCTRARPDVGRSVTSLIHSSTR